MKQTKDYIILLLGLSLPWSLLLSNYIFVAFAILLVIISKRRSHIQWLPMSLLLIPVAIPIISLIFHGQPFEIAQLEVRLPFLVTALLIGFFKLNPDDLRPVKKGLIGGTIIAVILTLLVQFNVLFLPTEQNWLDLTYAPLFAVIGIIILWYTDIEFSVIVKIILSVFLNLSLIFIGNIFFLIGGVLIAVSAIIVKGNRLQSRLTILFVVLLGAFVLYKGAAINDYIRDNKNLGETPENKTAQWLCVLEVLKQNEFLGVGYHVKRDLLIKCYHSKDMVRAEENAFNAHNEYLDFFLTLGYIGVIALMGYFIHAMFLAYDDKQTALLLIIMLIALFALNENIFTRQKGVMITAITYLMIYANYLSPNTKDKGDKDESNIAVV